MTTSSTTSSPLLFPAFSYGDHTSCRRKMKAEAKKWAKHYQEHGDFPEPKLIPVPPGSAIYRGNQNSIALMNMGMRFEQTPGSLAPDTVVVDAPPNRNQPRWYFNLVLEIESETAVNHPGTVRRIATAHSRKTVITMRS